MTSHLPFFTIVVPTHNRPRQLAACLESLVGLDYPRDRFEVIVVDDESPSSLEPVVDPMRGRVDLTLIRQPHSGPATARNNGAARARGEFLAFIDDDCMAAPNWLRRVAVRLAEAPGDLVGGQTLNRLPDNPYSTASQVLIDYLYAYFATRPGRFFTANNLAIATARFWAVGGFDRSIALPAAEDREFCVRWVRHGNRLTYAPEVLVHHAHSLNFPGFWRQHFNYGRGAYFFRRLVDRGGDRVRLEPVSFYMNLLRCPLARRRGLMEALRLSLLLGVSQFANASGFAFEKARPRVEAMHPRMEGELAAR